VEPSCPQTLGAGESCAVTLSFAPTGYGMRYGELTVQLGKQKNHVPISARGYDLELSLSRPRRPSRTVDPTSATSEAFANLAMHGIEPSEVRLSCTGAPTGAACDVSRANDGTIRVALRRTGRLLAAGVYTVELNATVGTYTQSLPLQLSAPSQTPSTPRSQRLSRSR
jgi:hypothetical protein